MTLVDTRGKRSEVYTPLTTGGAMVKDWAKRM